MQMTRTEWRAIADEARTLIRKGHFIDAIRLLRTRTGSGLKEAHAAATALRKLIDEENL